MLWHRVFAGNDFVLGGRKAPSFPLVINDRGVPHRPLNAYLRYRYSADRKDIKTVRDKDAHHIMRFFNYLYVTINSDAPGAMDEWLRVWDQRIDRFHNVLSEEISSSDAINQHLISIYQFYWWCEKNQHCQGIIGINDLDKSDFCYPIRVLQSGKHSSNPFKIPGLEKVSKRQRLDVGTPEDWDRAYEISFACHSETGVRNELMLRMVREVGVRREELAHLRLEQFDAELVGPHMMFSLEKDKNSKRRTIKVNAELYRDIQNFIEYTRPVLIGRKKDQGYVFTGQNRGGKRFSLSYINEIFTAFGVKPHDGRSVSLTERFVALISSGMTKDSAILIVSQEAGHALASRGETLERYYFQAEAIAKAAPKEPIGMIKALVVKQQQQIAGLQELVLQQQRMIDELKSEAEQNATMSQC